MKARSASISIVGAALVMLALAAFISEPVRAAVQFNPGDVLVGRNSTIGHYSNQGVLLETLDTTTNSSYVTGMCFDPSGNLLTTDYDANKISKFSPNGVLLQQAWFSAPGGSSPETCVRNRAGHYLVGLSGRTTNNVVELDANGTQVQQWTVAVDNNGADWIDLGSDQCTLTYSSEGAQIKRFNVCTNTQLPDFATVSQTTCWGLRVRPNGEVLAACDAAGVKRFSPAGTLLQTYTVSTRPVVLSLDPDGTSFWVGDATTHKVDRIDFASGTVLKEFVAEGNAHVFGLAVVGELTAALVPLPSPSPSPVTPTPSPVMPTASPVTPQLPRAGAPLQGMSTEGLALVAALVTGFALVLGVARTRRG